MKVSYSLCSQLGLGAASSTGSDFAGAYFSVIPMPCKSIVLSLDIKYIFLKE